MTATRKPIIYQLVIRYFGNTNLTNAWAGAMEVNGCGKFNDITSAAIDSLRQLGITHIWLTGCLRQATLTAYPQLGLPADDPDIVKGRAGSFYAVRDYFDVCPDYAKDPAARIDEFEALVTRIHAAGLKVLIDFVPNHVGRSYSSAIRPDLNFGVGDDQTQFFSPANCFFYLVDPPGQQLRLSHPAHWQPAGVTFDGRFEPEDGGPGRVPKATGNAWKDGSTSQPSENDWYEAVKLNYGFNYHDETGHYSPPPRTWLLMDEVLTFWQSKGVDGFRCDMAQLVPREAWSYLIRRARQPDRDPSVFFLAEAYVGSSPYDPVKSVSELLDAGFDAVYHDNSYNRLTGIYSGRTDPQAYDDEMKSLSARERQSAVEYLENHDKPRVAAAIGNGGFGSAGANYQLAPLQFLYSNGPALILNGQEIGESGDGFEGFSADDGRTTFFDYWCMPEFSKWVNGHAYDGGLLSPAQTRLRRFFADLISLCQDASVRANGYWSLKYFNRSSQFADCPDDLYTFARFESGSGRMLLILTNFRPGATSGRIRIPPELSAAAKLPQTVSMQLVFNRGGACKIPAVNTTRDQLATAGFAVLLSNQETQVYLIHYSHLQNSESRNESMRENAVLEAVNQSGSVYVNRPQSENPGLTRFAERRKVRKTK